MTKSFLNAHVVMDDDDDECYGLGVYVYNCGNNSFYYAVGGDCGINFFTAYFPRQKIVASALGNTELNAFPLLEAIVSALSAD